MAYTPELSQKSSCTLRRISWALNIPMTKQFKESLIIFLRSWTGIRPVRGAEIKQNVMTVHLATNILEGDIYAEKYDNAWKGICPGRFHVTELF